MAGKLGPFIIGGALGAIAALLYAPRTGEETRAIVADKANEAWGQAQQVGASAQERGTAFYGDAVSRGQEAYQTASEAARSTFAGASGTAQDWVGRAQDTFGQVAGRAQETFQQATGRVQEARGNAAPAAADKNDELRQKIEAARARIASQVAANAESAHQAASEQIPVEPTEVPAEVQNAAPGATQF